MHDFAVFSVLLKRDGGEHRLCGYLLKLSDLGMARAVQTNQLYYKVCMCCCLQECYVVDDEAVL